MLTEMLSPGTHHECFEITVLGLEVSTNSPSRRAVAAPDASVLAHGTNKLRFPLGTDAVFNRDQDRAVIGVGANDKRQAPMIPGHKANNQTKKQQKTTQNR